MTGNDSPFLDPDDPYSGWKPAIEVGPAPDLTGLDAGDELTAEWLLSDHPWAVDERRRRRDEIFQRQMNRPGVRDDAQAGLLADVEDSLPDHMFVAEARRQLEAQRRYQGDPRYVYPPGLIGPIAAIFPPPGHPPHTDAGIKAGDWNGED